MANYPDSILCSKTHEYIIENDDELTIGITEYAAEQLGEIVYVELPDVDTELAKGDTFSTVESVKAASEIYMPVTGKITQINNLLSSEPEKINDDPYGDGWIVKITGYDKAELENFLSMDEYKDFIEE